MLSIYKCLFEEQQVLKRKYGKFPAITVPNNVSKQSLKKIQAYMAMFKDKVAKDSQVVEKSHLEKK